MSKDKTKPEWNIDLDNNYPDDSLLTCLMIITKYYQNPSSAASLTDGLPLEGNTLTPALFKDAAARAGLKSQVCRRKLNKISKLTLPAILLLKNQQSCILLEISDDGIAKVITPETGTGFNKIPIKELKEEYTGYVIFARPEQDFANRGDEFFSPQRGHWFWSVFKKSIPIYSEVLVASFFINLFAIAFPFFIINVYNRVIPNQAFETLWVLSAGIGIVFVFEFILKMLRSYFIDNASKTIDLRLSSQIFSHILDIKMAARPQSAGALANAIQSFESFRNFLTSTTITVLIDFPFFFLFIGVLFLIGGNIGAIPLITLPLMLAIGFIVHIPLTNLTRKFYSCGAEKQATLLESIGGTETIKTCSAEGAMQSRWLNNITESAHLGIKLRMLNNISINASAFIQHLATISIIILGVYKTSQGTLTTGGLIACFILGRRALAPLAQASSLLTRYHQSNNSLQALNKIMQLPTDRGSAKKPLHKPTFKGDISFENVNFTYPSQPVSTLKDISFSIKQGEKVAFIGRIGSGKTTILKLILGLYQANDGSILVDGTEINQINPGDVRRNIGYIPQDITLFYGSIKDNITFGANYVNDEEILHAARIAGMDRYINAHPDGFHKQVGERGTNLSGGQRQTVAIARAMLLKPQLMVFDEPTNSMDDNSEGYFRRRLEKDLPGKTLLLGTHKASMLSLVDRIIVVENGKIMADGPKEQVIAALQSKGKSKAKK